MLDCQSFYDLLTARGISFFAGVPDSLLKDICAYITDHSPPERHIITANEGSAVALAAGHTMATGRPGLVYMQNSGLGNTINPVTSLADPEVYGIPMLLFIGWRAEPGHKDEPQHKKMGRVTLDLLTSIGVPHAVLPDTLEGATQTLDDAIAAMNTHQGPFALVVKKNTFATYKLQKKAESPYQMTREGAIEAIVEALGATTPIVSTTGMPSRELFEVREHAAQPHDGDFLTVGSMGHSSQIALGVALENPQRDVYCLDGDGAVLMHMGGLATIGSLAPGNYKHIVLNNGAHDSVGGQPTVAFQVDLLGVARACGYTLTLRAESPEQLTGALAELQAARGPAMLEVRVKKGNRADLGRPTMGPRELKERFSAFLAR